MPFIAVVLVTRLRLPASAGEELVRKRTRSVRLLYGNPEGSKTMPAFVLSLFLTAGLVQSAAPITGIVLDPAVPPCRMRLSASRSAAPRSTRCRPRPMAASPFPPTSAARRASSSRPPDLRPATADVADASGELRISLEPAPFFEAVNVTSSRTDVPRADPTVTVTVIPASELLSARGGVDRRRAEDGAGIHALPPHFFARVEPDRPGRLAARPWRHRAPADRWCSPTAFR